MGHDARAGAPDGLHDRQPTCSTTTGRTRVGSLEKGKFADVIAVAGNPLTDVTEMERVKFVMKGGIVDEKRPRVTAAVDGFPLTAVR